MTNVSFNTPVLTLSLISAAIQARRFGALIHNYIPRIATEDACDASHSGFEIRQFPALV